MKRIFSGLLAILMLMTLSACSSSKLADIYSADEVITRAKKVVEVINTLDYDAMNAELREDLRSALTAEQLKTAWDTKLAGAGSFTEYTTTATAGQKSKSTGEDYAIAILVCKYEKASLTFTISMDKDMQIVGLYMK